MLSWFIICCVRYYLFVNSNVIFVFKILCKRYLPIHFAMDNHIPVHYYSHIYTIWTLDTVPNLATVALKTVSEMRGIRYQLNISYRYCKLFEKCQMSHSNIVIFNS